MPRQRIDKMGQYGLVSDPVPSSSPPNSFGTMINAVCADDSVTQAPGQIPLFALDTKPIWHFEYIDATGKVWFIISDASVLKAISNEGVSVNITPTGFAAPGALLTFCVLNTVLVINSSASGPFYWNGVIAKALALPGWPSTWRCKAMGAYRYYLVAMNTTRDLAPYPHEVRWSTAAEPGAIPTEWTPLASNSAGNDILGDTPGHITGGVNVQESFWVVKEDSIYSMDWVGGSFIMQSRRLQGAVGTPFFRGFAEFRGGIAVATKSDLFVYDGQQSVSLTTGKVRRSVSVALVDQYAANSQLYVHAQSSTLWFCTAAVGSDGKITDALILDLNNNTWGHKKFKYLYGLGAIKVKSSDKFVWNDLGSAVSPSPTSGWIPGLPWNQQNKGTWDQQVYDSNSPDLISYESNDTDSAWLTSAISQSSLLDSAGNQMYSSIERIGIPIEGSDGVAAATDVWLDLVADVPMKLSVCGMDTLNSSPVWDGPYSVDGCGCGTSNHVDIRVTGRYLGYKLESDVSAGYFQLNSLTIDWEHDGER